MLKKPDRHKYVGLITPLPPIMHYCLISGDVSMCLFGSNNSMRNDAAVMMFFPHFLKHYNN